MVMLEQMVETRAWKAARGLIEDGRCRVCQEQVETVEHLVAGCKVLANTEYLTRHNRAMMIMAVAWAKEHELIRTDMIWYEERWKRGTVIENDKAKLLWDFEFNLRKTTTSRRPDLILEEKEKKKIWICDMACPQQHNIENKKTGKAHQISSAGIRNERETFRVRNNSCASDYWSLRWRYEKDDE